MDAKVKQAAISAERAKFVELAQSRMNRAIKAIRAVGQLDRQREYDADNVDVMVEALSEEVAAAEDRLRKGAKGEPDFHLYCHPVGAPHEGGEGA